MLSRIRSVFTMKRGLLILMGVSLLLMASLRMQEFIEDFDDNNLDGWEHSENVFVEAGALHIEPFGFAFYPGMWGPQELSLDVHREGMGDLLVGISRGDQAGYTVRLGMDFVALFRMEGEEAVEIAFAPFEYPPPDEWFRLTISYTGQHVAILIFDQLVIEQDLDESVPPGGLELRTEGDAVGVFDNLHLIPLGGEEPGEPMGTEPPEPSGGEAQTPAGPVEPAYQSSGWVFLGGPTGGLGYDIRMRPDNPDVMFVTDAYAGVFKSTDGGATWFQSNTGITTRAGGAGDAIPVFSLTIDPNDPDTVWIGTQYSSGVYRSTDGGNTWTNMNTGSNGIQEPSISVRGLSIEPGNSDVVYMAGEISSWDWNGTPLPGLGLDMVKGVIYKTTDGGKTWSRLWYGDNLARYVLIDPTDTNRLYASTGIFDREAANSDPVAMDPGGVGILRSKDGGKTWEVLDENNGLYTDELYFGSLFMHPDDPDTLFAAAGNDPYNTPGGIFRTTDGGDTWTKVLDMGHSSAVEVCESNTDVVYAGSFNGFARSDDGGDTWINLAGPRWGPPTIVAGFPIDMQCDPRDADRIFVNNYGGGNFLSEDAGETWVDSSQGYTGALMSRVVVASDNPGLVYASARSGLFASWDGGDTWEGLSSGVARDLEGYYIAVDPFDSLHIYAGLIDTGFMPKESLDGGTTWKDVPVEYMTTEQGPVSTAIDVYFDPSAAGTVFFSLGDIGCRISISCNFEAGKGLIYTTDGGNSWAQAGLTSGNVVQLAFSSDDDVAYAALRKGELYRSSDGGMTWDMVNTNILPQETFTPEGFPTARIGGLMVDSADSDTLYMGLNPGGIFISRDGGQSWQTSSAGMPPEVHINDLIIDPTSPTLLYASTVDGGVYLSQNSGQSWQVFNQGLTMREVTSLTIASDGSVLYAATNGAGVYRLGTPVITSQPPTKSGETPSSGGVTEEAEQPAGEEGGFSTAFMVGIGVVVVVAVVVIVLIVIRRRRKSN